jgi:hypothetical protein
LTARRVVLFYETLCIGDGAHAWVCIGAILTAAKRQRQHCDEWDQSAHELSDCTLRASSAGVLACALGGAVDPQDVEAAVCVEC